VDGDNECMDQSGEDGRAGREHSCGEGRDGAEIWGARMGVLWERSPSEVLLEPEVEPEGVVPAKVVQVQGLQVTPSEQWQESW
jgi:hypothetical protein